MKMGNSVTMTREVIMAGFGGQGIMLIGQILAMAGMLDNKNVTWFPSYGAQMRGGTANCTVVISDQIIGSPIIDRPWAAIVMNQPSLEKFAPAVKKDGILLINSSLAEGTTCRDDIEVLRLPLTQMADKLGTIKVANIIGLSAFCAKTQIVSMESLEKAMEEVFSSKNKDIIKINHEAICTGREQVMVYK